jgi:hypothetical protein
MGRSAHRDDVLAIDYALMNEARGQPGPANIRFGLHESLTLCSRQTWEYLHRRTIDPRAAEASGLPGIGGS